MVNPDSIGMYSFYKYLVEDWVESWLGFLVLYEILVRMVKDLVQKVVVNNVHKRTYGLG